MWLVTAFLLMAITQTHADYASLQAVLSQNGLQKVSHWMTDWLQKELSTITLPEVSGSVDIFLGSVYYVLHDMTINRCDLPEPSVAYSEGTGVSLQVNGLSLVISGHWNTKFGLIHDSGWFDLAIFGTNLETLLGFQKTEDYLSISTLTCFANVGGVEIHFHGGGSFIFQPFVDEFSGEITDMIRERNGFELNVKGEFYSARCPSEPPFSPNHFDLQWQADYMMSVGISEFCVNSAAFAYFKSGVMNITITDGMLPKKYPDMEMEIVLYASDNPKISFNHTVISLDVSAAAKFYAIDTHTGLIPLFRLDMQYSFTAQVQIDKQLLTGFLKMKK
ncbi:lipopolysaccharide-binding protein [Silurus meridionalis]|nr:lipopolysaccharide-binding protein [Silurus meridionalis]